MSTALRLRVTGIVQGVGFRPFVWRLARELGLSGWVRNDGDGVHIHAEGDEAALGELALRLKSEAPPLARVDGVTQAPAASEQPGDFRIEISGAGPVHTAIGADSGLCPACLVELFDPAGRRWRHGFITCTHCGPRYTVTRRLPYDRPQTSLAPFPLCLACEAEYTDPADRRFHAETTCCPECGPQLRFVAADGQAGTEPDPIAASVAALKEGKIVAVKGLGGFHLMCLASDAGAVARLRQRKDREEKPFALLLPSLAAARQWAEIAPAAAARLVSPERPVLLLPKRPASDARLPGLAPGLAHLGLMLPVTPIQYLLFHEAAGRPTGVDWLEHNPPDFPLVATSANPGGEPLVIANDEALARLAGIADAFLLHDRDIVVRCDDSVLCDEGLEARGGGAGGIDGQEAVAPRFIRRARGYTPQAIKLASAGPCVLALGGWFKNTFCVTRGDEAFVSQHIGDLDSAAGCGFLEETVAHLLAILDVQPDLVAHDLHPDFFSSRYALSFAAERGAPAVAVQHHHAHIAATLAERRWQGEPVLGLALDGVGLGSDGGIWGGELLHLEGAACRRLGHLQPLALPGGDKAAREPWRMAASALHHLGRGDEIAKRFADQPGAATIAAMLNKGLNCPPTSSMGRLFDAAAGLLKVKAVAGFEGQAAMLLEGLAAAHGPLAPLPGVWRLQNDQLDFSPLLQRLADENHAGRGAALFHATLAAGLTDWLTHAAKAAGLTTVAGGGGCFLNRILCRDLHQGLAAQGIQLLLPQHLPANDGGLSLGQAWVARLSV